MPLPGVKNDTDVCRHATLYCDFCINAIVQKRLDSFEMANYRFICHFPL